MMSATQVEIAEQVEAEEESKKKRKRGGTREENTL